MNVGVDKVNGTVSLNQENYVDQLLNRFDMVDCKVADTPLENKLNVKTENKNCESQFPYQQLVGEIVRDTRCKQLLSLNCFGLYDKE